VPMSQHARVCLATIQTNVSHGGYNSGKESREDRVAMPGAHRGRASGNGTSARPRLYATWALLVNPRTVPEYVSST